MVDSKEKLIPIETDLGQFHVWTKSLGNNPRIKVLLLHGGPGGTSELFEDFEKYFLDHGIEFYYYNQLGSFESSQPIDQSLWTIDRFVDEVEQVRKSLQLSKENFYLLGHSWGGILALEYAFKYPHHLKGLIISNMMSSAPDYDQYAQDVLSKQFDPQILQEIKELEKNNDYQNPRYMELLVPHYYSKHVCRSEPWSEHVHRFIAHLNNEIYTLMQGPSEFGISGLLKEWDRSKDLSKLEIPTLTIGATHDTMDPNHMKWMATQIPKGSFLFCPLGSHCSMVDDQEHYFPGLIQFLQNVDQNSI